ncbi:MAG: DUF5018 domain-containing protein [Treponema sp.]|nr:DUF5018 domain-containing protein [Treponema sp.]
MVLSCSNPLLKWIDAPEDPWWPVVAAMSDKLITSFSFGIENETVLIRTDPDGDGMTPITVVLPPGANYGLYNRSPQSIEFIGKTLSPPADTPRDFSDLVSVVYRVTGEDGSYRDYKVHVHVRDANSKEIIWFDLQIPGQRNRYFLEPGMLITGKDEFEIHVPSGTDLSNVTAEITHTGERILDPSNHEHSGAAVTLTGDFSSPVTYTVYDQIGNPRPYLITVIRDKSDAKDITDFSFQGLENNERVLIGAIPLPDGKTPIVVEVPPNVTLDSLSPRITHTGVSITGPTVSGTKFSGGAGTVYPGSPKFSNQANEPVTYTVTAEDGTTKDYTVAVYLTGGLGGQNEKIITGFYIEEPLSLGAINQDNKTILVSVPHGTDLAALKPTVYYRGISLDPGSGIKNDFRNPVIYTVRASNGTAQPYTVLVNVLPSGAKEITKVEFKDIPVRETIIGAAPGPDGKIPISVTVSGSVDLKSLVPSITHTGASISPNSGQSQNFTGPVTYTVTAEDGSSRDYALSVHVYGGDTKIITGFSFRSAPASPSPIQVVGLVDQNTHSISVVIPIDSWPSIGNLAPTLTWVGDSIEAPTGGRQQANPFADSPRDFSNSETNPLLYTVYAADGSSQPYTVTLFKEERNLGVTVIFQGLTDKDLITENFDQASGLVTITVNQVAGYGPPYEWYLDGKQLPVSSTETTLVLRVQDLQPGQHEVVLAAKNTADTLHYTNKVYFLVTE